MGWTKSLNARWRVVILSGIVSVGLAHKARAIYLDDDQNISLRSRIYSQGTVRIENSGLGTEPTTEAGQLVQHRNYFNPELDAKLTSYTSWMKGTSLEVVAPDEFATRLAAWGFYDGIYDYGSGQFQRSASLINSTFNNLTAKPRQSWFLEGANFNPTGNSVAALFPGTHVQNPHDIYASQRRINEAYVNYTKGPLFVRIGKQAISWGESDTIALLDQNNPFDVTLGAPGVFEDLDEARIPLWTVRSSYNLFDTLGPLSSAFIEGYWVPGNIDTNTGILPILTASPYSPRGLTPQQSFPPTLQVFPPPAKPATVVQPPQTVLLDHTPHQNFNNSRWGVRLQTLVNRTHTVSAWFYTHFPNAPVPRGGGGVLLPNTNVNHPEGGPVTSSTQALQVCNLVSALPAQCIFTTETVHRMTPVVGLADTFFLEPLDGIVRTEAEYFIGEPSFIPQQNLSIQQGGFDFLAPLVKQGSVPRANYLRWELGFDRFFFARFLNPTNSFTWVTAMVGSWNLDETSQRDFRQSGVFKPEYFAKPVGTVPQPNDFVQQKKVEAFFQTHLQSDYLHGRLTPGVTVIQNVRGTYAIQPDLLYRWTDWLLFDLNVVTIGGEYQQLGFFRDRDQIWFRTTYQLN